MTLDYFTEIVGRAKKLGPEANPNYIQYWDKNRAILRGYLENATYEDGLVPAAS